MRNPARIRKFCNELATIWESECPDWRFGQLIENVFEAQKTTGFEPFYYEDDRMMQAIKRYFGLEESE